MCALCSNDSGASRAESQSNPACRFHVLLCNICSFLCLENRLKGKTVIGGSILAKVSVTSASFRTTFKRGALLLDEVLRSDSYLRKDRGPHTLIHILSLQCHITFSILCKTTSNGKNKVRKTALALV